MQLNHYNTSFAACEFPIVLICDNITKAANIGSLFRIADAFGVRHIVFCGTELPLGRKMTKTSRSTEKIVSFSQDDDIAAVIQNLKKENHTIIALEISSNSQAIHDFNFNKNKAIALVIGDENFGVSEAILNISDHIVHIDMFGQNSSMNVVQACNIALYEITKQLR